MPLISLVRSGGATSTTRLGIAAYRIEPPNVMKNENATSIHTASCHSANAIQPPHTSSAPTSAACRAPCFAAMWPLHGAPSKPAKVAGIFSAPASVAVRPSPMPVHAGCCPISRIISISCAVPRPNSAIISIVRPIWRSPKRRTSIIGFGCHHSRCSHSTRVTSPTTTSESVSGSFMPLPLSRVIAHNNAAMAGANSTPPSTSSLPVAACRVDAGSTSATHTSASAAWPAENQKIQRQPTWSTSQPPSRMPAPALKLAIAASQPMPTGTRAAGRCSRTRPMHSGSSAAEKPCTARPAISHGSCVANAAISEPAVAQASISSTRRLRPYRSPSREHNAADTAPTSRNAVISQPVPTGSRNSRISVASAPYIIPTSKALVISAITSTTRMASQRERSGVLIDIVS